MTHTIQQLVRNDFGRNVVYKEKKKLAQII